MDMRTARLETQGLRTSALVRINNQDGKIEMLPALITAPYQCEKTRNMALINRSIIYHPHEAIVV